MLRQIERKTTILKYSGLRSIYFDIPRQVSIWRTAFVRLTTPAYNVSIGVAAGVTPDAKLEVLGTTEQLRLSYDQSNQASFSGRSIPQVLAAVRSSVVPVQIPDYLE